MYDFGPPAAPAAVPSLAPAQAASTTALPALALAEVQAGGLTDGSSAVLYRLAYANAQQLRPYTLARWSQPPAQLVQRDMVRAGQLAHGQLFCAAHIQQVPFFCWQRGNIIVMQHLHIAAQHIGSREANLVHGVARGAKRRRVG